LSASQTFQSSFLPLATNQAITPGLQHFCPPSVSQQILGRQERKKTEQTEEHKNMSVCLPRRAFNRIMLINKSTKKKAKVLGFRE
jgi:hypothetical protein